MNLSEYIRQPNWCNRLVKSKTRESRMIKQTMVVQTPFLPDDATLQQRAWHILNYVNQIPVCPRCSNLLKFQKSGKYSKYCSQKCNANSPETILRKKNTLIETHGSEESYKTMVADRFKNIALQKYGVENVFQANEVKLKSKERMMELYGVEYALQSDHLKLIAHNKKGAS